MSKPEYIEIHSQPVNNLLNRLIRQGQNMSSVMEAIGMEFESRVSNRFETQTDPNGIPWAPWKPSTVKNYPKDGNKRLLDRSGDMLASLTHQSDNSSAVIGFGQPYAQYHETGTKNMLPRLLLTNGNDSLGSGDELAILRLLNAHFGG